MDINLPSSVTEIGISAFLNCSELQAIILPAGLTSIGYQAFKDCSKLVIFAEADSKPAGWDSTWNYSSRPVYWNGQWSYDEDNNPIPN